MPAKDIWTRVATHQLDGIMFHTELTEYFLAMSMDGFAEMQKHQLHEETCSYFHTFEYYAINYRDGLLNIHSDYRPNLIPDEWHTQEEFNYPTEKWQEFFKNAYDAWAKWEKSTVDIYLQAERELRVLENSRLHSSDIYDLAKNANIELQNILGDIKFLNAIDWDIIRIRDMQVDIYKKYHNWKDE